MEINQPCKCLKSHRNCCIIIVYHHTEFVTQILSIVTQKLLRGYCLLLHHNVLSSHCYCLSLHQFCYMIIIVQHDHSIRPTFNPDSSRDGTEKVGHYIAGEIFLCNMTTWCSYQLQLVAMQLTTFYCFGYQLLSLCAILGCIYIYIYTYTTIN